MTAQLADPHEGETPETQTPPDIDRLLVSSIMRWAVTDAIFILLFDIALMTNYPFPVSNTTLRGVFYSVLALAILGGTLFITFLGYRLASMRVVKEGWRLYLIFLPALVLFASISGFLLLGSPK